MVEDRSPSAHWYPFRAILFHLISAVLILFANWQVVRKCKLPRALIFFKKKFFCKDQTTHYLFNENKSNNDP